MVDFLVIIGCDCYWLNYFWVIIYYGNFYWLFIGW